MMRNERNTFVKLFKILTFVNVYAFSYIDLVLKEWIISPIKVNSTDKFNTLHLFFSLVKKFNELLLNVFRVTLSFR